MNLDIAPSLIRTIVDCVILESFAYHQITLEELLPWYLGGFGVASSVL